MKLKTIRSKLFFSYGIILVLFILIFGISYLISKNTIQKSAAANSLNSVRIIGQKLNSEIEYLFNLRDHLYNNSDVNYYINHLKRETDKLERHYDYMKLNKILNDFTKTLIQNNKNCEIILYTDPSTTIYYSWENQGPDLNSIQEDLDVLFQDGNMTCTSRRESYNPSNQNEPVLYFYKSYQNVTNQLLDFYIIIGIPESTISQYFEPLILKDSSVALLNEDDSLIISSSPQSAQIISSMAETGDGTLSSGYQTASYQGKQYIQIYTELSSIDWKLTQLMPIQEILKDLNTWSYAAIIGLLFLAGCMFLICLYVNHRIAQPIHRLDQDMQKVKKGDFQLTPPKTTAQDEIGRLSDQFYEMVTEIDLLNQEMLKKESQKRNLEIEALQAQINPHFIYNTINSIKMLLRLKRPEQVHSSLTALVDILKNTIARPEKMVTLEQELQILKSYIYIQQTRYSNFQFDAFLPDELKSCCILRFLIQPFMENSLLHGFQEINEQVRISVSFQAVTLSEKQLLEITITDNGMGMDEATIQKITSGSRKTRGLNGIGVSNVIERVRLNFGAPYSVHFDSTPAEGTRVVLHLPLIQLDMKGEPPQDGRTD